jgi:GTP-binding protein
MVYICPPTAAAVDHSLALRSALEQYSPALAAKDEIIVANKMDLTDSDEHLAELREAVDAPVLAISAVTGKGLEALAEAIWQHLQEDR